MTLEISQAGITLLDRVNTVNNAISYLTFLTILKVNTILLQPYWFQITDMSFIILFGLSNSV